MTTPASTPQPSAPAPERSSSLIWWIVGIVLAAVLILGLGTALIAFYFARQVEVIRSGADSVEVRTPAGTLRAGTGRQETGLPEYPGVRSTETPGTVELAGTDEHDGFIVTVAKFRTPDSLPTVDEWYRERLPASFEREAAGVMVRKGRLFGTEIRSSDIAYIEEKEGSAAFVVLRRYTTETEIVLARIGKQEVQ